MDFYATSDSVSALSLRRLSTLLNYKVAKWAKYKLLNLRGNHLLAAFVFVPSVFGENIPTAEFGMTSAETACWAFVRSNDLAPCPPHSPSPPPVSNMSLCLSLPVCRRSSFMLGEGGGGGRGAESRDPEKTYSLDWSLILLY
jgi:hypothetical protein